MSRSCPGISFASNKGGCGKSTLAHHLAVRAKERRLHVLAIDTDRQAGFYRRLLGDDANLLDCPVEEWAPGCHVAVMPEKYALPDDAERRYDLVIIDTPPSRFLPEGPPPEIVVIPVDGAEAARNANETLAAVREQGVAMAFIILNGIDEGGKRHARELDPIRENLPEGVTVLPGFIPRGGSIKRAEMHCRPSWADPWPDKATTVLRAFCDAILDAMVQMKAQATVKGTAKRKVGNGRSIHT